VNSAPRPAGRCTGRPADHGATEGVGGQQVHVAAVNEGRCVRPGVEEADKPGRRALTFRRGVGAAGRAGVGQPAQVGGRLVLQEQRRTSGRTSARRARKNSPSRDVLPYPVMTFPSACCLDRASPPRTNSATARDRAERLTSTYEKSVDTGTLRPPGRQHCSPRGPAGLGHGRLHDHRVRRAAPAVRHRGPDRAAHRRLGTARQAPAHAHRCRPHRALAPAHERAVDGAGRGQAAAARRCRAPADRAAPRRRPH
jgi:hypothetical protein